MLILWRRQRYYAYGNYIDEVLFTNGGASPLGYKYYVHDHLYSPVTLVNSSGGTINERYEYDAYGNCHVLEPNFAPDPDGLTDYSNPCLFTGRRVDILDNSSLKIQYNRNRYYDSYTGRWTTHDPLAYMDSMNLYEYVNSSPLRFVDPHRTMGVVSMGAPAMLPVEVGARWVPRLIVGGKAVGVGAGVIGGAVAAGIVLPVIVDDWIAPEGHSAIDGAFEYSASRAECRRLSKAAKCHKLLKNAEDHLRHINSGWDDPSLGNHLDAALRQCISGVKEGADHLKEFREHFRKLKEDVENLTNDCAGVFRNPNIIRRIRKASAELNRIKTVGNQLLKPCAGEFVNLLKTV